jgi:sulfur carrier protein ThiS
MSEVEQGTLVLATEQADGPVRVHVKLMSRFRKHLPPEAKGEAYVKLPPGATLNDLMEQLAIHRRVKLFAVNDEQEKNLDRVLCDGDSVRVYPFVVGG